MSIVDYSQPISAILRQSTKEPHEEVEKSAGAIALAKGKLLKDEYIRFLMMLYGIYNTFERALERHSSHPVLEPTYNPSLLARTPAIESDISYLLGVPQSKWKDHPIYIDLMSTPPAALTTYVNRIEELSKSSDPAPLLAHSYVRYLGDLSGGQFIKRTLAKAYNLKDESSGLEFFKFRPLDGTKGAREANTGEMKKIKEWFRDGMDKGVGDDFKVKSSVAAEAGLVFKLNQALFDTIEVPDVEDDITEPRVVAEFANPEKEGGYNVASVATFILAVGLAHFILTVGGFTGSRGEAKLEGFFGWVGHLQQLLFPSLETPNA